MSTQPDYETVPSQPPPQTTVGVLQQQGILPTVNGSAPGERPDKDIHMARAQLIGVGTLSSDDVPGTEIIWSPYAGVPNPQLPLVPLVRNSAGQGLPYACQFYFHQSTYWNAEVRLHFWAVKPPASVGRIRVVFTPAETELSVDAAQREITEEWDLSLTNIFEFKIPNYNLRQFRNCVANYAPLNGNDSQFKTPRAFFKLGTIRLFVTHIYQPGSIFPSQCSIYVFQSFLNSQFAVATGPGVPTERTALSSLLDQT